MEERNPDNEKPDARSLAKEQSEKEETEEQLEEGEERAEDYVEEEVESTTSLLLREIGNLEVRTLDDLRRIKQMVCASEGKDKC